MDFIDLGDQSYGEWIICDNQVPKYHVSCWRQHSESDIQIRELLNQQTLSIENIIELINKKTNQALTLAKRPAIELEVETKLVVMQLDPIPLEWLDGLEIS